MLMRMALGVPIMAFLAPKLHSPMWHEVQQLRESTHQRLLLQSVGCGLLMFLYLALLYVSIGLIPTGIALTLFFTYPAFTALFSWQWFGNRPSLFQWSIMALVLLGSFLTMPAADSTAETSNWVGITAGLVSGVTYALYSVVAQKSFEQMHPVPFTWISFTTTLVLSGLCLLFWQLDDTQIPWLPLWIGGFLSAIFTFSAHLMNNFGIHRIGATTAAMLAASNPALTVILAWFAIQETLNGLQVVGVSLVTLSIALLTLARTKTQ